MARTNTGSISNYALVSSDMGMAGATPFTMLWFTKINAPTTAATFWGVFEIGEASVAGGAMKMGIGGDAANPFAFARNHANNNPPGSNGADQIVTTSSVWIGIAWRKTNVGTGPYDWLYSVIPAAATKATPYPSGTVFFDGVSVPRFIMFGTWAGDVATGAVQNPMDGAIERVAFWNNLAVSDADINAIFAGTKTALTVTTPADHYYAMLSDEGGSIADTGNTGGAGLSVTGALGFTAGPFSTAGRFGGGGDIGMDSGLDRGVS